MSNFVGPDVDHEAMSNFVGPDADHEAMSNFVGPDADHEAMSNVEKGNSSSSARDKDEVVSKLFWSLQFYSFLKD